MRQDTNFSSMDKHFIVEYPLQRNQALGNEYSSDRNLKDAACALLQFSLRPVSRTQLRTAEIQYLYPTEIGDTQPGITVAVNNVAATVEQISTSNPNSQLSRSVEEGEMKISLNINPETSSVLILYDPAILRFVNEMEDDNTANELQKLRASIEFVGGLTPMENEEASKTKHSSRNLGSIRYNNSGINFCIMFKLYRPPITLGYWIQIP